MFKKRICVVRYFLFIGAFTSNSLRALTPWYSNKNVGCRARINEVIIIRICVINSCRLCGYVGVRRTSSPTTSQKLFFVERRSSANSFQFFLHISQLTSSIHGLEWWTSKFMHLLLWNDVLSWKEFVHRTQEGREYIHCLLWSSEF